MHPLDYAAQLEESFRKRYAENYYSTIEMEPGKFTPGGLYRNIALTRTLLGRTGIEGKDCADVAAVDGWCAILMARRGARRIAAFDRNDFTPLIDEVRSRLGVSFDYFPLLKTSEIPDAARQAGFDGFDVVVNSGLLYHVLGPINSIAATRSLVRTGGILIVETVVDVAEDGFRMSFNHAGEASRSDPTFFWSMGVKMYDYMLRMLRLQPIDCCYFGSRMAIACRAVDVVPAPPEDDWLPRTYAARDILDFTDWSILDRHSDVTYRQPDVPMAKGGGADIWQMFKTMGPLPDTEALVRIHLADKV